MEETRNTRTHIAKLCTTHTYTSATQKSGNLNNNLSVTHLHRYTIYLIISIQTIKKTNNGRKSELMMKRRSAL